MTVRVQRSNWLAPAVLYMLCAAGAFASQETTALVKKYVDTPSQREKTEKKLRDMGMEAVSALRDVKSDDEKIVELLRGLIVDILMESSKADPEDAQVVHEVAREEGKTKHYGTAERLYTRAKKLYEDLRKDAADRKDKIKEQEYKDLRDLCEKMKDKANRKDRGDDGKGVNLGIVRVGVKHDMSDDWD